MKNYSDSFISDLSKPSTAVITIFRIDIDGTEANDIWLSNLAITGAPVPVYRLLSGTMPGSDVKFDEQKANMSVGGIQFDIDDSFGKATELLSSKVGMQNWYLRKITQYITTMNLGWSGKQILGSFLVKEPPTFNGSFYKLFCYDYFYLISKKISMEEQRFTLAKDLPWNQGDIIQIKNVILSDEYATLISELLTNGYFEYKDVNGTPQPTYGWTIVNDPLGGSGFVSTPTVTLIERTDLHTTFEVTINVEDTELKTLEVYGKTGIGDTPDSEAAGWRLLQTLDVRRKSVQGWGVTDPFRITVSHNDLGEDLQVVMRFINNQDVPLTWSNVILTGSSPASNEILDALWANKSNVTFPSNTIKFEGTTFCARYLKPLPKNRCGLSSTISTTLFAGLKVGICEYNGTNSAGKNGYFFKFTSSTTGELYKVDSSGAETLIGSAVTFQALTSGTPFNFEVEIYDNKIVIVVGSQLLEWQDTTYRVHGWHLHIKYNESSSSTTYINALYCNIGRGIYEHFASSDVLNVFEDLDTGLLKAEELRVKVGAVSNNLVNFFELRGSTVCLKSGKLLAGASAVNTDLPAVTNLDIGTVYLVKGDGLYMVGVDGSNVKQWWKISYTIPSFTPGGNPPGGGDPGGGGTCFVGEMCLEGKEDLITFEEIKVGDIIRSCNQNTGTCIWDEVISKSEHLVDNYLLINEWLGVTREHLLFGGESRIPCKCQLHSAGSLFFESEIFGKEGAISVCAVSIIVEKRKVYSITTRNKCYWVTDGQSSILAHNAKNLDL